MGSARAGGLRWVGGIGPGCGMGRAGLRPEIQQRTGGRVKGASEDFRRWAWPNQKESSFFSFFSLHFPNLIFNAKTFPRNPRKCFKAQKILRKFQKFQENSQS
jgi:hypothetical protein